MSTRQERLTEVVWESGVHLNREDAWVIAAAVLLDSGVIQEIKAEAWDARDLEGPVSVDGNPYREVGQ